MSGLVAIVPVDDGEVCVGGEEVIAEAEGRCILIGSKVKAALVAVAGLATEAILIEAGPFRPAAWAQVLTTASFLRHVNSANPANPANSAGTADEFDRPIIVMPGSPDGRQLAPRLAHLLDWPLVHGATQVDAERAIVASFDGQLEHDVVLGRPAVVVLEPGVRGVPTVRTGEVAVSDETLRVEPSNDADLIELLPADPATIDLAEAKRVVAGGAGLGSAAVLDLLGEVGLALGASLGATRVLSDAGWIRHSRQIGTTGTEINPDVYLAVGISGAVQHIMGIGNPTHVVAVNTDASCPMMSRADIAIVTDAPAYVAELANQLGVRSSSGTQAERVDQ